MFVLGNDGVYRCEEFSSFPWLEHGFGTRLSEGWLSGRRLAELKQIHSATVREVGEKWGNLGEGDGLVTSTEGTMVGVRTADCVPILIVDVRKRAVAAVHAGWRGIVGNIGEQAIEQMVKHFVSQREDLRAAIGPAIGRCCFEVGPEVGEQFRTIFPERQDLTQRPRLDLEEAVFRQLTFAGVGGNGVFRAGACTVCRKREFYSFRRERESAGQMWSAIGVKEPLPAP